MNHKLLDIGDINYILRKHSDSIPEDVVRDIYFKLLDYVPVEELEWDLKWKPSYMVMK